jgi:sugar-specific transcriptional regulator TrmB/DNA-binding CsgD family transcriptional regulator
MNAPIASDPNERPLDILGISEAEERAYDWLLAHSGATIPEVAQALTLTPGRAHRLLDTIEAKGLVTRTPERPRRYIPTAPDIALRALSLQRHERLRRAENAIQKLQDRAVTASRQSEQEQIVELLTSYEAERQTFEQMVRTAQHEIITLTRLPIRVSKLGPLSGEDEELQKEAQARGVSCRSIVDAECLSSPDLTHKTLSDVKAGEEARVTPNLPFKMLAVDRSLALVPLKLEPRESPLLILRSSALLDALYVLFEMLWERAAPIPSTSRETLAAGQSFHGISQNLETMVQLMATGLNDKKIADELDISMRTLRRHTTKLTKELGATTRFQAGWLAALQLSSQQTD